MDATLVTPEVCNETLRLLETPEGCPSFWNLNPLVRQSVFQVMLPNCGLREGEDWGMREATAAGVDRGKFWTHTALLLCWRDHVWADHLQCWVDRADVVVDRIEEEYRKKWSLVNQGRSLPRELIWTVHESLRPARLTMVTTESTRWALELERQLSKGLAVIEQKAMEDHLPPGAWSPARFRL
jgi:hypothetical protein